MTIEMRTATEDDLEEMARADGRAFGHAFSDTEIEQLRAFLPLERFVLMVETGEGVRVGGGPRIVGIAGAYPLDVTLPGGAAVPMAGITWVSVASTHRRQGLLGRMMDALHTDADERGEPLAMLGASEGGIYERFGYGCATQLRFTSLDPRTVRRRAGVGDGASDVRHLEGDAAHHHMEAVWERVRRLRAGEVARDERWWTFIHASRATPIGEQTPAYYLCHPDGYATYRLRDEWNQGMPAHTLEVTEFAAATAEAHAALWTVLLGIDLVGTITSRQIPLDDPLPLLLDNQRALRTVTLNDGYWANVRDVAICFGARTYSTTDKLVVEADGRRWAIDGSPDGAECTAVRSRPDIVTDHATLGALLLGGIRPTYLAAGGRLTARNADALRRADAFFTTGVLPHCQTHY